jgi:hypothetical protein
MASDGCAVGGPVTKANSLLRIIAPTFEPSLHFKDDTEVGRPITSGGSLEHLVKSESTLPSVRCA